MNLKEQSILLLSTMAIFLLSGKAIIWILLKIFAPDFFLVKRKPKLIKKLPSEISVAEEKFSLRVQNLFPPGTSDEEIRKELSNQGFSIRKYQDKETASYKSDSFFCSSDWFITWKVDDKHKIYNLKANYSIACL